jgi:hypothetical protein
MRKFLNSRFQRRDLANLLASPVHARWAAPQRLPYFAAS